MTASSAVQSSPAPGTYAPYEDAVTYRSPSALLTSRREEKPNSNPAPGQYDIRDNLVRPKVPEVGMGKPRSISARRLGEGEGIVGPGSYNPGTSQTQFHSGNTVIHPSLQLHTAKSVGPDPGSYHVSDYNRVKTPAYGFGSQVRHPSRESDRSKSPGPG